MAFYVPEDNPQLRQMMDNLSRQPGSEEKYQRLIRLLQNTYNLSAEEALHWINHWVETHTLH